MARPPGLQLGLGKGLSPLHLIPLHPPLPGEGPGVGGNHGQQPLCLEGAGRVGLHGRAWGRAAAQASS